MLLLKIFNYEFYNPGDKTLKQTLVKSVFWSAADYGLILYPSTYDMPHTVFVTNTYLKQ